jgi:hypothetical protein
MTITKCDICKKMIKKDQLQFSLSVIGGHPIYVHHTICMDCGNPIMPFLKSTTWTRTRFPDLAQRAERRSLLGLRGAI